MGRSLEYYLLRNGVNTLLKTTIFNRLTFVIPCLLVFSNISFILILLILKTCSCSIYVYYYYYFPSHLNKSYKTRKQTQWCRLRCQLNELPQNLPPGKCAKAQSWRQFAVTPWITWRSSTLDLRFSNKIKIK